MRILLRNGHLDPGDRVVFIAGHINASGATNAIQILDMEDR